MGKQITLATLFWLLSTMLAAGAEPHPLVGTWKKVAGRQSKDGAWVDQPAGLTMLKHITPTHVTWTVFRDESKEIEAAMGGSVEMDDKNYSETVEHGLGPVMSLLGKKQAFTWKIENNVFIQVGTLSNGVYIEERFERLAGTKTGKR